MGKGQDLTHPNRDWGICGFVSVLGSLYDSDPKMKAKLNKILDDKHFETRLLADIKTFLVMLQADNKTALLNDASGLRVATLTKDDRIHLVPVGVERDTGSTIEIASGLDGGERIVKVPTVQLVEGTPVEAAR